MNNPVRMGQIAATKMIGKEYNRLTIIQYIPGSRTVPAKVICQCKCGNITQPINPYAVRKGLTTSCGCRYEETKQILGNLKRDHQMTGTVIYGVWQAMIRRCENKNTKDYGNYGGRGIRVCTRWRNSFTCWHTDMGARPAGYTIERIDNNGNYSCGHCAECTANQWTDNCK